MFDSQYEKLKIEKSETLKSLGINPYKQNSKRNINTKDFLKQNQYLFEQENRRNEDKKFILSGRVMLYRIMGKASFLKIQDDSGMVQVYMARDNLKEGYYNQIKKLIDIGDFIEINGFAFITQKDEITIYADEIDILTKSICVLPEKFHGVTDKEILYRQRYLDLIMNPDSKNIFQTRSKIIKEIRNFFDDMGCLEVETPMMHDIAGGANAKPFITHHNALGVDKYLRIAPELYLKRLIVGGFESVFEINRNFRNEGMDATHNPEFTMVEFYLAYKNYNDLMNITENLFSLLLKKLDKTNIITYQDEEINMASPFKRIKYIESLHTIGGIDKNIIDNKEELIKVLKSREIEVNQKLSLGHIQAEAFDEFVEDKLRNPTFITDFPVEISPLARKNDDDESIVDRFELFIAGKEIANGFNELNDPVDQYERFKGQIDSKDKGDGEAHEMDKEYVKALGFAMPPTAGEGIGIDRLVMLLTDTHSIRDVLLFPSMKPQNQID